jgi:hypothetical protein
MKWKNKFYKLSINLLIFISVNLQATGASPSFLKDIRSNLKGRSLNKNKNLKISSKIEKIKGPLFGPDWDFSLNFPEFPLGNNAGINTGYNYKTSYLGRSFIRTDTFKLGFSIHPGDIFGGLPLYLNLSDKTHFIYKRRFASKEDAKKAGIFLKPFFPSDASQTTKNMKPGDIFSFPTTLHLALGSSLNHLFPPSPFMVGLKGEFFITGQFIIHVLALTENRFRLKIESISDKGLSGGAYAAQNYILTNIKFVDGIIKDVFYFDLASVGLSYKKRHHFLIDYVFNFNDPEARKSFNQMMSSTLAFKTKTHFNPFKKGKIKHNQHLISSLKMADRLALKDLTHPLEKRRVIRIFKGTIDTHMTSMYLRLSAFVASSTLTSIYSRQKITSIDESGYNKKYYFPTYMAIKRSGLILGKLSKFDLFLLSSLYELDENDRISDFNSFGTLYFNKDFSYSNKDLKKFKHRLQLNLPEKIYESIPWPSHLQSINIKKRESLKNALSMVQILLNKDIFDILEGMNYSTLQFHYKKYYNDLKKRNLLRSPKFSKILLHNRISIRRMLKKIETILNSKQEFHNFLSKKNSAKSNINKFMGLRNSPLFKSLGLGFFLHLLKGHDLKKLTHIFILLSSQNKKGLQFLYGDPSKQHLFKTLRSIQLSPSIQPYDYRTISYPK